MLTTMTTTTRKTIGIILATFLSMDGWMTESEWRMVMGMGWLLDGDIGMFNTTPNALFDFNFNMI